MAEVRRSDVELAAKRIESSIHRTPVLESRSLNEMFDRRVFFKCENFQKVGAFKARGALNAVLTLGQSSAPVVTHSSGNHGAALAWAARSVGKSAYVICPNNASRIKREAIERYGGVIIDCGPEISQREAALQAFLQEREALFVPPYDHPQIIAGQGTATLELLQTVPQIKQIWVPIGGGGLAAGAVVSAADECEIVGSEPELARDAHDSLVEGRILPALPPETIADGLRSSLGNKNFDILFRHKTQVHLVTESEIVESIIKIWQCLKIVIEPSSAVPVAAALKDHSHGNDPIGIILSGGNYLPETLGSLQSQLASP